MCTCVNQHHFVVQQTSLNRAVTMGPPLHALITVVRPRSNENIKRSEITVQNDFDFAGKKKRVIHKCLSPAKTGFSFVVLLYNVAHRLVHVSRTSKYRAQPTLYSVYYRASRNNRGPIGTIVITSIHRPVASPGPLARRFTSPHLNHPQQETSLG